MLKTVAVSSNGKTGPLAVTYRSGEHETYGTCPSSCKLHPKSSTGTSQIDAEYLSAVYDSVPRRGIAWTYSHFAAEALPLPAAGKTTINASCDTVADAVRTVELGGFQLETAGALSHGKRVWALASVGPGADIVEGDMVKPYLLFGTSYDGTMATVAKFTSIRVVCNNTITAALGDSESTVRVLHSEKFDADAVRLQLGIVANTWERFLVQSRKLATVAMPAVEADEFVTELLRPYTGREDVSDSRAYKRVMALFNGRAIGSELEGVIGTRWGMLNAVTELVDHERGRSDNTRLESAWFGTGAAMKARALELLAA